MDKNKLIQLFGAIDTILSVKNKMEWCLNWFNQNAHSFSVQVIVFAIVEGVFFSSLFATIFWVHSQGILPGLCHSNELIMCDEGLHMEFTCKIYWELTE